MSAIGLRSNETPRKRLGTPVPMPRLAARAIFARGSRMARRCCPRARSSPPVAHAHGAARLARRPRESGRGAAGSSDARRHAPGVVFARLGPEGRVALDEGELHRADRPVAVLADDDVGDARPSRSRRCSTRRGRRTSRGRRPARCCPTRAGRPSAASCRAAPPPRARAGRSRSPGCAARGRGSSALGSSCPPAPRGRRAGPRAGSAGGSPRSAGRAGGAGAAGAPSRAARARRCRRSRPRTAARCPASPWP